MKGETILEEVKRTRSSDKDVRSISFRITPEEFEAIKVLNSLDGAKGSGATARTATLKAMYERVPQDTLDRLGLTTVQLV